MYFRGLVRIECDSNESEAYKLLEKLGYVENAQRWLGYVKNAQRWPKLINLELPMEWKEFLFQKDQNVETELVGRNSMAPLHIAARKADSVATR